MSVNAGSKARASRYNTDILPGTVIARGRRSTNSSASTSTTLVPVLRLDDIPITAGRLYRISTAPLGMDSTVAADTIRAAITYTTDASTPTISSTILPGGLVQTGQASAANGEYPVINTTYAPAGDETLSLLLSVARQAGAGSVLLLGDTINIIEVLVEDIGVDPGDTGTDL